MYFLSLQPENLNRRQVKQTIGKLRYEEYESVPLSKIHDFITEAGISSFQVKFYKETSQDEFNSNYECLVVYYDREETDAEYNKRILLLNTQDLHSFVKALTSYNSACLLKKEIQAFYDEFKKNKYHLADWQEKQLLDFLKEKTTQELVREAYDKGKAEAQNELTELKKKIKNLT